jgi:hypothetical protein
MRVGGAARNVAAAEAPLANPNMLPLRFQHHHPFTASDPLLAATSIYSTFNQITMSITFS